ncbi:MAG: ATP synthase F1 subunit delta [Prolixibacteraceae bacterium]|nr:ATP synthase F1 subunit delta [Prolixibacteraceae bacterium]
MDESAITVRYSKALFSLANESEELSSLKDDMELFMDVYKNSEEFKHLLKSPVIKGSEKFRLLTIIFKGKVSDFTINFFRLVIQNKRESFLPLICRYVLTLIKREKGIKTVVLTTAAAIDDDLLEKINSVLERELESKVELANRVNPEIIGGIILRIDDKQYDASVITKLKDLKNKLLKAAVQA